jgi:hypothetical protein
MDRKKHIIINFLSFIREKYDTSDMLDEVIPEPTEAEDKKTHQSKVKQDTSIKEEIPTKEELKKDLISLVEEYKMLFEK